jgi:phosphoribosylamine--glycine ligase
VQSAGGRVLSVVGTGEDLGAARDAAYVAVGRIRLAGSHHRRDIAELAARGAVSVPGAVPAP